MGTWHDGKGCDLYRSRPMCLCSRKSAFNSLFQPGNRTPRLRISVTCTVRQACILWFDCRQYRSLKLLFIYSELKMDHTATSSNELVVVGGTRGGIQRYGRLRQEDPGAWSANILLKREKDSAAHTAYAPVLGIGIESHLRFRNVFKPSLWNCPLL